MDGILNINKPAGMTSFRAVSVIKKLCREKRVGHAGTLDPAATGVLPVCIGQATRVVEFIMDFPKTYRAGIELGLTTSTCDAEGEVIERKDASGITRERFEEVMASFRGEIRQTPPMYSALRYKGKRLYELARKGVTVDRKSRSARIYRISLLDWQPPRAYIEVECGKGTYIRTLACDIGEALGCGACLSILERTRYGIFNLKDAMPVAEAEAEFCRDCWQSRLYPIDSVLADLPSAAVDEETAQMILNGRPVTLNLDGGQTGRGLARAYASGGQFIGVLKYEAEAGLWKPEKVFAVSLSC